jgi:hypothetical protein
MKNILKLAGLLAIAIMVITCTPKQSGTVTQPQTSSESETTAVQTQTESKPTATQTQSSSATAKAYDYLKILKGDLSEFAGILWVNKWGHKVQFMINVSEGESIRDFQKNEDGSYYWTEGYFNELTRDGWRNGIYLYPIGVEIITENKSIVPSDTTKIRMGAGNEPPNDENSVFY